MTRPALYELAKSVAEVVYPSPRYKPSVGSGIPQRLDDIINGESDAEVVVPGPLEIS